MAVKYVFVTGGVVSGLGKGITAASLGRLLKARGFQVTMQKFDPFINESFIMAKIQVGLGSIVCYEDFSMLNRVHGSGINVDVRVKFIGPFYKKNVMETLEEEPYR